MRIYIHDATLISPQRTFEKVDLTDVKLSTDNRLTAIEPPYEGIPRGILRRMGKAVRLGVGAAMPLIQKEGGLAGIILGTANGGMEDCVRFFNQIIDYDEGNLTPTNFVQSTTNAIASQIGLMTGNKGYNSTHVHAGLAFENALIDTFLQLGDNPEHKFLVGGVDEISDYNYNIDYLGGWNKVEILSSADLYDSTTPGSIAGEGAAMFVLSGQAGDASTCIEGLETWEGTDPSENMEIIMKFLASPFAKGKKPDLILSGENGDIRELEFYRQLQGILGDVPWGRFKHLCGEYPTAQSAGLWFAHHMLREQKVPDTIHSGDHPQSLDSILVCNSYHQSQCSLTWVNRVH